MAHGPCNVCVEYHATDTGFSSVVNVMNKVQGLRGEFPVVSELISNGKS